MKTHIAVTRELTAEEAEALRITAIDSIDLLRWLVKQANNQGCNLHIRKGTKYPYHVSGTTPFCAFRVKMGGTAEWLYDELMKTLVERIETNNLKRKG